MNAIEIVSVIELTIGTVCLIFFLFEKHKRGAWIGSTAKNLTLDASLLHTSLVFAEQRHFVKKVVER